MRKKCELCNRIATSYCESDEASLCWACDASVHRANFLAAKHTRVVLCRVCQDPTRWRGSGVQLDPAARACPACIDEDDDDVRSDDDGDSCIAEEESDNHDDEDEDDDGHDGGSDDDEDQLVPTPINIS